MNIPEKWFPLLDMLGDEEFKTLIMAMLRGEDEPTIATEHQPIAQAIYREINLSKRSAERMRKYRAKQTANKESEDGINQ